MTETPNSLHNQLGAAAALAEQGFLAAGENLEAAVGILDRLTARFAAYVAELTGEGLAETRRNLAAVGTHVATLGRTRGSDMATLAGLGETVTATGRRIATLHPIVQEVATLSLSARVVAGGMGHAAGDFTAFAGGIADAAGHARDCLTGVQHALGQMARELAEAQAGATLSAQRHGPAMQAIPERVVANLRSLAAQQQRAAEAATAAHRQSEAVRRHVAEQMVALQLGDITRQRLEHVQMAAGLLAEECGQAGDLLSAQLLDAADDLVRQGDQVEAGLSSLVAAAQAIGELGAQLHGGEIGAQAHGGEAGAQPRDGEIRAQPRDGEIRAQPRDGEICAQPRDAASGMRRHPESGGGFVAALEMDIRQTAVLFSELGASDETNGRQMEAVLKTTDILAARLTEVQSVQEDLRIMGLNASLKCGRLGTVGRPLSEVAQELRRCGMRFEAKAASVLSELDGVRTVAEALHDPARHEQHAEMAQAADALIAPLRRLHELEHDLVVTLSQLHADAAEVGRLVEGAIAQFSVRHALAASLRDVAVTFAAWPGAAAASGEVLDRVAAAYTMERERAVHARFAPLPRPMPPQEVVFF